jgi:hypothetical protein
MASGAVTMPAAVEKILSAGIVTVISWVLWSAGEGLFAVAAVFELAGVGDGRGRPKPVLCSAFGSCVRFDVVGMFVAFLRLRLCLSRP